MRGLSGYLLTTEADVGYISGFGGDDSWLLVLPRDTILFTDGRYAQQARQECPHLKLIVRKGRMTDALAETLKHRRINRLAFDSAHLTVDLRRKLGRKIGRSTSLVGRPGWIGKLRQCKDNLEIKAIRKAVRIAEGAFEQVLDCIRSGETELAVAARLEYEMRQGGASGAAFPIIIASGPAAAMPHYRPGNKRIRPNTAVLCDWGACVDFYRSDLTRVVFPGRIPPRLRRIYPHVLAAQQAGIADIVPGRSAKKVYEAAKSVLEAAGLAEYFVHGLGHGIGREIHELPGLSHLSRQRLAAGNVLTVEPGVYLPGSGGIRIEDDVLVTDQGCEVVSRYPKDLESMVL